MNHYIEVGNHFINLAQIQRVEIRDRYGYPKGKHNLEKEGENIEIYFNSHTTDGQSSYQDCLSFDLESAEGKALYSFFCANSETVL